MQVDAATGPFMIVDYLMYRTLLEIRSYWRQDLSRDTVPSWRTAVKNLDLVREAARAHAQACDPIHLRSGMFNAIDGASCNCGYHGADNCGRVRRDHGWRLELSSGRFREHRDMAQPRWPDNHRHFAVRGISAGKSRAPSLLVSRGLGSAPRLRYDPLGSRWPEAMWEVPELYQIEAGPIPAGLLTSARSVRGLPGRVHPEVGGSGRRARHGREKLNLLKKYSGFRPKGRTVGRGEDFRRPAVNYLQQTSSRRRWGTIIDSPPSMNFHRLDRLDLARRSHGAVGVQQRWPMPTYASAFTRRLR